MENTNKKTGTLNPSEIVGETETKTKKCWACFKQEGHYAGCRVINSSPTAKTKIEYQVVWFYMANYGLLRVMAYSPEEAIKEVFGGNTDEIRYLVTKTEDCHLFGGN